MELHDALRQISDIRQQMAKSEVFRGYRSLTVGFSGVLGILAAIVQQQWLSNPQAELGSYVGLWMSVALTSLLVAGGEMFWRANRAGPGLARDMTVLAAEQFLPCLAIGALLTLCIVQSAPHVAWMLPGLWAFVFGLGVFASCRLLPPQAVWVGVYFAACGCACLLLGKEDEHVLSPWLMGCTFGGGQLFAAAILYWTLERTDAA